MDTKIRVVAAASLLAVLSGCSFTSTRKLPHTPGKEIVSEKKCGYNLYPFCVTAGLLKYASEHSDGEIIAPVAATLIVGPLALVLDAVALPVTIPMLLGGPTCKTDSHQREIAGYPFLESLNPISARQGARVVLQGRNFAKGVTVRLGNAKVPIENLGEQTVTVRVPADAATGRVVVIVENSVGKSDSKTLTILPSKPPLLKVVGLDFRSQNNDGVLSANRSGIVTFTVTNAKGAGDALDVGGKIEIIPDTGITAHDSISLGNIKSGARAPVSIPVTAGPDLPTGKVTMTVKFDEAVGFPPDPVKITFEARRLEAPELVIAGVTIDDTFYPNRKEKLSVGNGNGIIEPGESVEVSARLANKGTGASSMPEISVTCAARGVSFLTTTTFDVANIPPGGWTDLKFVLSVRKDYEESQIPLVIHVKDIVSHFSRDIPVALELSRLYSKVTIKDVAGRYQAPKKPKLPAFGDDLLPPRRSKVKNPDAVAVILGVKNYKNPDVPIVDYAQNDAQVVRDYAVATLGIKPENVIFVLDPTKGDLERIFGTVGHPQGQLFNSLRIGESDVFVYYSGHGAPDLESNEPYLVPTDADPNYVRMNGYPVQVLLDNLNKAPAREVTLVLDACFSGNSEKGTLLAKASPLALRVGTLKYGPINAFASSAGNQISSWYPEKLHGLFTYYFLKALRGEGDKKRRQVTAGDVRDFLRDKVPAAARRLHGREQVPEFHGEPGQVMVRY